MFATDRDLLALEPNLFRDVGWTGQRLVKGTATISFVTLIFDTQDVGLDAAGVDAGHVVVVAGTAYEVIARSSASAIDISRLRPRDTDDPISPSPAEGSDAFITSFRPQIEIVHRQVLRTAGIEPDPAPGGVLAPGQVGESAITNPADLKLLEALGALHLIYSAAAAGLDRDSPAAGRAEFYRDAFARQRERTIVTLDLDHDGEPDASRCLATIQLARA